MMEIIAMAVAANRPGMSERTKRHWRMRREEYTRNARAAAAKAVQKLKALNYEPLRGVPKSGVMAATPDNQHARTYSLISPDGQVYVGRNIADLVRQRAELFSPDDLRWYKHTCNAAKSLAGLRPGGRHSRPEWKGWRWCDQSPNGPN